jgi:hypothetical protein
MLSTRGGESLFSIIFLLGTEMKKHNLNNIKNNSKVTAVVAFVIIAATATFSTTTTIIIQSAYAVDWSDPAEPRTGRTGQAPSVVTGDNVYIAWWNGTAGEPDIQTDVMFRASTDGGETFSDKINLSNTTDSDSWRVEIAAEGENVVVSWWETMASNQTTAAGTNQTEGAGAAILPQDIPVMRVSNDGGETFGPILMLATNGTIGVTEEGGEGAGAGEAAGGEEEGE